MPISVHPETQTFHLYNNRLSYLFTVREGYPFHLYFGACVPDEPDYGYLLSEEWRPSSVGVSAEHESLSFEHARSELSFSGVGDMRLPALEVVTASGSRVLNLTYRGYELLPGKPELIDLPATYAEDPAEADTLILTLADDVAGVEVRLAYTVFSGVGTLARSMQVRNTGAGTLVLERAMSGCFSFEDTDFEMIQLAGAWARERSVVRAPLHPGIQGVYSLRGHSGHHFNPFVALTRPQTTETAGEAYGFCLVYSGNHALTVDVDPYHSARVLAGVNPEGFSWPLAPGETFQTPEVVAAFSDEGLGGMSRTLHTLFRERLARGAWRDKPRPILINNWEATYFHFDEEKLVEVARAAADLGIELFVLDDGWFTNRDDDFGGLGDWEVNTAKLPSGLGGLARRINELGMDFGLWIEPEMVNPGTRVWDEHPEWVLHAPGQPLRPCRHQYVLDFSNPQVVDYLYEQLEQVISSANISYIKWDMNRSMADVYSQTTAPERQGCVLHASILGVYRLYDRLTKRFPGILFESCAGGGGRFDAGMLAFAPQAWTSDDTDAVERLRIQWGTSLAYPVSSMGSHVSAVPNHQVFRSTPLKMRADVAYFGTFGYELDATALTEAERAEVRGQVAFMKDKRALIQFGDQYRLKSPFEGRGNECAWMVVAPDKSEALVAYYRVLQEVNVGRRCVRLAGLEPEARYELREVAAGMEAVEAAGGAEAGADALAGVAAAADAAVPGCAVSVPAQGQRLLSGAELMRIGLDLTDESSGQILSDRGDFISRLFTLKRVR